MQMSVDGVMHGIILGDFLLLYSFEEASLEKPSYNYMALLNLSTCFVVIALFRDSQRAWFPKMAFRITGTAILGLRGDLMMHLETVLRPVLLQIDGPERGQRVPPSRQSRNRQRLKPLTAKLVPRIRALALVLHRHFFAVEASPRNRCKADP